MSMDISSDQLSVSICCELDEGYRPSSKCNWEISIFTTSLPEIFTTDFLYSLKRVPCLDNTTCYTDFQLAENNSTYLLNNGTVSTYQSADGRLSCRIDGEYYCYGYDTIGETAETIVTACKLIAGLRAGAKVYSAPIKSDDLYFIILMCISLPFLALTFLVYSIVPALKNLHGLILRSYMSCCFIFYMWGIAIFIDQDLVCRAFVDISTHFAILATCFWLNVMSFDIWWTFRSIRIHKKQSSRKKFIIYSLYAWGSSILIIAVGFIIEFIPDLPEEVIKPGYHLGCWLVEDDANAVYLKGPTYFTFTCNMCFFILVVIEITRYSKNTTSDLEGNDNRRYNSEKNRFYLYLKLSVLMGITWFAEVAPSYLATILELPNILQGLILFILFVCNNRTRRLLSEHLGWRDWKTTQWMNLTVSRIFDSGQRRQV